MPDVRKLGIILGILCLLAALSGCSGATEGQKSTPDAADSSQTDGEVVDMEEFAGEGDLVPLAAAPAISTTLMPVASGTDVRGNDKAAVDVSNLADGYVMIRYLKGGTSRIKVIVTGPSGVKYTYNLRADGEYETFPLSDGSGTYQVTVYRNVQGSKYATECSEQLSVRLKDEFAPFLLPNQYVNYTAGSQVVKKAAELTKGLASEVDSIKAVYNYVVSNLTYDKERAATVKSGYLPNLDDVLAKKKGICFDYAALMTAMLRSRGIPCKLVVGYAGTVYHAWINAYSETQGWISNAIYFDGTTWKLMDPTFASTGKSSPEIMKYIGDGSHYTAKYLY